MKFGGVPAAPGQPGPRPGPAVPGRADLAPKRPAAITVGAQRRAAELGLALITPDTSPRGANVPGEAGELGLWRGAGFTLDATQAPWATHWRMESYLMNELLALCTGALPIDAQRLGILATDGRARRAHPWPCATLGGSNLGVCAHLRAHPMPLGEKAFTGYLRRPHQLG